MMTSCPPSSSPDGAFSLQDMIDRGKKWGEQEVAFWADTKAKQKMYAERRNAAAAAAERSDVRQATVFAPTGWDDYIGQHRVKMQLQVLSRAAASRGEPVRPLLFIAPPGSGKTTIAELVSREIDAESYCAITRPPKPAELLGKLQANESGLVLVDECHQLASDTEHMLMQLAEDRRVDTKWGFETFPDLSIILATTEPEKVGSALRSRCQIVEWDPYTDEEMSNIVRGMADRAGVEFSDEDYAILGHAAAGIPRRARDFVEGARNMVAVGLAVDADSTLLFAGSTREGLERNHIAYLEALMEMQGQAGLDPICTRLRLNKPLVKELERLLLDRGMVTLTPTGRRITSVGRSQII